MEIHYQVLLYFDIYNTDAISINKLCKLSFRYFTMYLAKNKLAAGLGFF